MSAHYLTLQHVEMLGVLRTDLRRYALSLCQSRSQADDLVQEAILRALQSRKRLPPAPQLKRWLLRVIRNLYIDAYRRETVRTEYRQTHRCEADTSPLTTDSAFDRIWLDQGLQSLSAEKQQIIGLIDVGGFSYAEVAVLLDIPIGTVMSRISRARRELLTYLQEEPDGSDRP